MDSFTVRRCIFGVPAGLPGWKQRMSVREASRRVRIPWHRDTVRQDRWTITRTFSQGHTTRQSPPRKPKLEPYTGVIDAILEADAKLPRKQRHTAKRSL